MSNRVTAGPYLLAVVSLAALLPGCGVQPTALLSFLPPGLPNTDTLTLEDDVPDNGYCSDVAAWNEAWRAYEDEVLDLVNENRAAGADCGSSGQFAAAPPLSMNPALRCAARAHSLDMATANFFSHTNLAGEGPGERMSQAGYDGRAWGENIAFGQSTPAQVVAGWMNSPGHCANIMSPTFTEIGTGYHGSNRWTQVFGTP
jgi:uncharacterized protein YkwD